MEPLFWATRGGPHAEMAEHQGKGQVPGPHLSTGRHSRHWGDTHLKPCALTCQSGHRKAVTQEVLPCGPPNPSLSPALGAQVTWLPGPPPRFGSPTVICRSGLKGGWQGVPDREDARVTGGGLPASGAPSRRPGCVVSTEAPSSPGPSAGLTEGEAGKRTREAGGLAQTAPDGKAQATGEGPGRRAASQTQNLDRALGGAFLGRSNCVFFLSQT